jgi:acetyl esterase
VRRAPAIEAAARTAVRGLFTLPDPLLGLLAGSPPPHANGLAPDAWMVARLGSLVARPAGSLPADALRRRFELITAPFSARPKLALTVQDLTFPSTAGAQREPVGAAHGSVSGKASRNARLYVPAGAPTPGPLLVYYHGGGWVQGSLTSHDGSCRLLSHLAGIRVLSVDYRLAPEHRFPAAVEDALAAYAFAAERHAELGADPARIAVGGDSAGGNLAAVTAQAAHGEASLPEPAFQLLIYPALDMSRKRESRRLFGERFLLTEEAMSWYEDQYVPDQADRDDVRVSPLLSSELAGLAPAYIATTSVDPLRDEGELYARRLSEAGVAVAHQRHPLVHGFINMSVTRSAARAIAMVAGALRQGMA